MTPQDGRIIRLGPFRGLDGAIVGGEATTGAPIPMQAGYNVEVRGGELWVRRGTDFEGGSKIVYAGIPWQWVIGYTNTVAILASPWHALFLRTNGTVTNITPPAVSETITFDGTSTATSTSTLQKNDLILVGASGYVSEIYRAVAVAGTTVTLDRNSTTATGATCRVLRCYAGTVDFPGATYSYTADLPTGNAALMDQLVTHSADDLYSGSPATTKGERMLIIASEVLSNESLGPVAVPLAGTNDWSGGNKTNWFRNTGLATPTAVSPTPYTMCEAGNRIIMAGCGDPSGDWSERTVWASIPGDFTLWHAGSSGNNAAAIYKTFDGIHDPIQAVREHGPNVIVHREFSQEIGLPHGTAAAPFRWQTNDQGIGLVAGQAIAVTDRVHYCATQNGPAVFTSDGGMQAILPETRPVLEEYGLHNGCKLVSFDPKSRRVYFWGPSHIRHQLAALPATDASTAIGSTSDVWTNTNSAIVLDSLTGNYWLEDHITANGWGEWAGNGYLLRPDGTVIQLDHLSTTGLDPDDTSGTNVVDAMVETPWLDLGEPGRRGDLLHVKLGLRSFRGSSQQTISDLGSGTFHLCTVEMYADHDPTTAVRTFDVNMTSAAMAALSDDANRLPPIISFKLDGFRHSAVNAKFRLVNKLSADATTAGHNKAHFRLAYLHLFVAGGEGSRMEAPSGE